MLFFPSQTFFMRAIVTVDLCWTGCSQCVDSEFTQLFKGLLVQCVCVCVHVEMLACLYGQINRGQQVLENCVTSRCFLPINHLCLGSLFISQVKCVASHLRDAHLWGQEQILEDYPANTKLLEL